MVGIISGTSLKKMDYPTDIKNRIISTPFGQVYAKINKDVVLINRHCFKHKNPPHRVNHKANIMAFKRLKIENIISINSVGSLKEIIEPGSILIPDDYIHFDCMTTYEKRSVHISPSLNRAISHFLLTVVTDLNYCAYSKGIYFQTKGPRFETRAEINMIKHFADVVGMTMASEATIAQERGMKYASLCIVDNYANGVCSQPINKDIFDLLVIRNKDKVKKLFEGIIKNIDKLYLKNVEWKS